MARRLTALARSRRAEGCGRPGAAWGLPRCPVLPVRSGGTWDLHLLRVLVEKRCCWQRFVYGRQVGRQEDWSEFGLLELSAGAGVKLSPVLQVEHGRICAGWQCCQRGRVWRCNFSLCAPARFSKPKVRFAHRQSEFQWVSSVYLRSRYEYLRAPGHQVLVRSCNIRMQLHVTREATNRNSHSLCGCGGTWRHLSDTFPVWRTQRKQKLGQGQPAAEPDS